MDEYFYVFFSLQWIKNELWLFSWNYFRAVCSVCAKFPSLWFNEDANNIKTVRINFYYWSRLFGNWLTRCLTWCLIAMKNIFEKVFELKTYLHTHKGPIPWNVPCLCTNSMSMVSNWCYCWTRWKHYFLTQNKTWGDKWMLFKNAHMLQIGLRLTNNKQNYSVLCFLLMQ